MPRILPIEVELDDEGNMTARLRTLPGVIGSGTTIVDAITDMTIKIGKWSEAGGDPRTLAVEEP